MSGRVLRGVRGCVRVDYHGYHLRHSFLLVFYSSGIQQERQPVEQLILKQQRKVM